MDKQQKEENVAIEKECQELQREIADKALLLMQRFLNNNCSIHTIVIPIGSTMQEIKRIAVQRTMDVVKSKLATARVLNIGAKTVYRILGEIDSKEREKT